MRGVVLESIMGRYEVSKGPALRPVPLLIEVSKAYSRSFIHKLLHHSKELGKNLADYCGFLWEVSFADKSTCLFVSNKMYLIALFQTNGPNACFTATKTHLLINCHQAHWPQSNCICLLWSDKMPVQCACLLTLNLFATSFQNRYVCLLICGQIRLFFSSSAKPLSDQMKRRRRGKQLTLLLRSSAPTMVHPWHDQGLIKTSLHIKSSMVLKWSMNKENCLKNHLTLSIWLEILVVSLPFICRFWDIYSICIPF